MASPGGDTPNTTRVLRIALPLIVLAGLFVAHFFLRGSGGEPLVVYCAHDSVYADGILQRFEEQTGIPVAVRYDTEATKSLGLVELLLREKANPRCDVFWNNQLLGTLQLQQAGVLHPYRGPGYERIPAQFRDPEGHWAGFGARLRVWIVNTEKMRPDGAEIEKRLGEGDLSRVAVAKPLYGTTLSHYTVLWQHLGGDALKEIHAEDRRRNICEVAGNAHVKNLVASGVCDFGLTDTDDFFAAKDEGRPVAMLPYEFGDGLVICIPNTVAVIKGTRRTEEAARLVDFLLSEECEVALARSRARQIPLGPVDEGQLPDEVKELRRWAAKGYSLIGLGRAWEECLAWLKSEYVK